MNLFLSPITPTESKRIKIKATSPNITMINASRLNDCVKSFVAKPIAMPQAIKPKIDNTNGMILISLILF